MILPLFLILACQLVGEALARLFPIQVPGPVVGMVLMAVALALSPRLVRAIRPVATGILGNLSLLFVPAGVGVIGHLPLLESEGLAIGAALVGSTILAIAAGAVTFVAVARLMKGARHD